jgi:hypothetical protein
VTLRSGDTENTSDPTLYPETTIISGSDMRTPVNFDCNETSSTVIEGFTITSGLAERHGGGIYCNASSPTIRNCILQGNKAHMSGGAIVCEDSNAVIKNCKMYNNNAELASGGGICAEGSGTVLVKNCLITNNRGYFAGAAASLYDAKIELVNCTIAGNITQDSNESAAVLIYDADGIIKNSIIWDNNNVQIWNTPGRLMVSYSDLPIKFEGTGNISLNPLFASSTDFHLKSLFGRFDPLASPNWVIDDVTSPCINAGDPADAIGDEPAPNGGRINMGYYGGTDEASMSDRLQEMPVDINEDGIVNFIDYSLFMRNWQVTGALVEGDFNGSGIVDINDMAIFAEHWLWRSIVARSFVNPIAGMPYQDWTVVNYVDAVAGSGEGDYRGGDYTYNSHRGIDFTLANFAKMDQGIAVYAAAAGRVIAVHDGEFDRNTAENIQSMNANYVTIDHDNGLVASYLHLRKNSISVNVGDTVTAGQQIAQVGSSGNSTDAHLHFELTQDGRLVDTYSNPSFWWQDPLPYAGDMPGSLDHGMANHDPNFTGRTGKKVWPKNLMTHFLRLPFVI